MNSCRRASFSLSPVLRTSLWTSLTHPTTEPLALPPSSSVRLPAALWCVNCVDSSQYSSHVMCTCCISCSSYSAARYHLPYVCGYQCRYFSPDHIIICALLTLNRLVPNAHFGTGRRGFPRRVSVARSTKHPIVPSQGPTSPCCFNFAMLGSNACVGLDIGVANLTAAGGGDYIPLLFTYMGTCPSEWHDCYTSHPPVLIDLVVYRAISRCISGIDSSTHDIGVRWFGTSSLL